MKLDADLVVLSACETGLGQLREGEGIVGLTRAFFYAGGSSVVVSLWKVEDQSTALLMEKFYQRLASGQGRAEALRQAKLEIMKTTVDLKVTGMQQSLAAPFFWAPFILPELGDRCQSNKLRHNCQDQDQRPNLIIEEGVIGGPWTNSILSWLLESFYSARYWPTRVFKAMLGMVRHPFLFKRFSAATPFYSYRFCPTRGHI